MLRYLTAGESHGPGLTAILDGMPAGLDVSLDELRSELARRRWCHGRGARANIENDEVKITGGVYKGKTTGGPVSVFIPNRDHENWAGKDRPITTPRPGHADLPGAVKYGFLDCRPVAERASARETAARVACAYFAKKLLAYYGIRVVSWVVSIGDVEADLPPQAMRMKDVDLALDLARAAESSPVRCPAPEAAARMMRAIDLAGEAGDSLGGIFEVSAVNVPPALGSGVHWDRRMDTRLAAAIMSINGVKGVEIGEGFGIARLSGRHAHDEIVLDGRRQPTTGDNPQDCMPEDGSPTSVLSRLRRTSNMAGGIEGGMTNGEPVFIRAAAKPVPTLKSPLRSVDLVTGRECPAHVERADVCAVGSTAVIGEAMTALVIADALLERLGGDKVRPQSWVEW
ncbi:MAG: chorismate synthase [Ignavibacteriales bacterium]